MKLPVILIYFFSIQSFAGNPAAGILSTQNTKQFNAQPKAPSIYDAATQVKKQNQSGQKQASMISSALQSAGQRLIASCCGSRHCASKCPVGIGLVVMAGMASKQAGAHGQTAGQAGSTMSATDAYADNYNNGRTVGADGSGFSQMGEDLAKKFAKDKIPVTFDGKKFVGPDGKKYGPDDMMSANSMAAAGISKDGIAAISAELSKANKMAEEKYKLTTPDFGFSEGGGGGAYDQSAAGGGADGNIDGGAGGQGHIEMGSMDARAATSGLTKDYNGDPIGVSNDSIFNMMARRYQLKERQDSFFCDSKAAIQK